MTNPPVTWSLPGRRLDLSRRALVMGILNVTPDSFSDGGRFAGIEEAMGQARRMIREGADLIDIGGESTRPGAAPVEEREELARTIPVVKALREEWDGIISIDTSKAAVAEAALEAGADVVNDVTGLRGDPRMAEVCRAGDAGVVVMHMRGEPRTMQADPVYDDVVAEVRSFFEERLRELVAGGLREEQLCFDPGIGFGKTLEHNLQLLSGVGELLLPGRPLLMGLSRKSFIGKLLGSDAVEQREWPTVALTSYTREKGAMIHRVHRVRENHEALRMTEAVLGAAE